MEKNYDKVECSIHQTFLLVSTVILASCGGSSSGDEQSTITYTVSGSVSGLSGSGLVIQNNVGDDLTITDNGDFIFTTELANNSSFDVTVLSYPEGINQLCNVNNGTGIISSANKTDVNIVCVPAYTISGTVSGLNGSGLILQNNSETLGINQNGDFVFTTKLPNASSYQVVVQSQPINLSQTCQVTNGNNNISDSDVTDVLIVCTTNTFSLSGTVSGITSAGLVIQHTPEDALTLNSNGSFDFNTSLLDGSAYDISIVSLPSLQACTIENGSANVSGSNVTNITISCDTSYTVGGTVSGLASGSSFELQNNLGDNLIISSNGNFTFSSALKDLTSYSVTNLSNPTMPDQNCTIENATGNLASNNITNVWTSQPSLDTQ